MMQSIFTFLADYSVIYIIILFAFGYVLSNEDRVFKRILNGIAVIAYVVAFPSIVMLAGGLYLLIIGDKTLPIESLRISLIASLVSITVLLIIINLDKKRNKNSNRSIKQ